MPEIDRKLSEGAQFAFVDVGPVAFREQEHEHPRLLDPAQHDCAPTVAVEALLPDVAAEIDALTARQLAHCAA
ncbi:hypothetical protein WL15_27415 [Burkholderia multivorans]|nr:hypothetical protein WL15_27415 [Burkholderia multivorans]